MKQYNFYSCFDKTVKQDDVQKTTLVVCFIKVQNEKYWQGRGWQYFK